ncbi:MAG: hypothetical protein K0Q71_5756, partial [Thermomicrobiales bacterium]|nr:hypothetical protein [Thermomicrobiales bacterium]
MAVTSTPTNAPESLSRWDLDSLFPGPESPEFQRAL